MRAFASSRAINLIAGLILPLLLLTMYHRLALLLPWHVVLIGGLLAVSAYGWVQLVRTAWLRAAAMPGLAFGAFFAGAVSLASVPLAAFALVGFGQRLTMRGDVLGALSLLLLAVAGAAPLLTFRAYWRQLRELRAHAGFGSSLALALGAAAIAACVWFGSGFTSQGLEAVMLEREWRPGGAWQRLFQFDAICESGCRTAFVRLYADARDSGQGSDRLERNFTLMYGDDLPAVWEAERLEPWRWRETASR